MYFHLFKGIAIVVYMNARGNVCILEFVDDKYWTINFAYADLWVTFECRNGLKTIGFHSPVLNTGILEVTVRYLFYLHAINISSFPVQNAKISWPFFLILSNNAINFTDKTMPLLA